MSSIRKEILSALMLNVDNNGSKNVVFRTICPPCYLLHLNVFEQTCHKGIPYLEICNQTITTENTAVKIVCYNNDYWIKKV